LKATSCNWRSVPYRLMRRFPLPLGLHWRAARAINDRFLLGVMGVIRDDAGRVLLFHHTYRRNAWGLPSGWMERGESPLAALEREVREESSLVLRADRLLMIGVVTDRPMMEFVVAGTVMSGEFRPCPEVSAARWCPPDEIPGDPRGRSLSVLERALKVPPGEVGQYTLVWAEERWGGKRPEKR
jgi:ADP-ribose pyrophosphatase YjhB (NUDIX family)